MRTEHERQLAALETRHRVAVEQQEGTIAERSSEYALKCAEYEAMVKELREEVNSSNNLRRQQLVELGLLREDERQKVTADKLGGVRLCGGAKSCNSRSLKLVSRF